MDSICADLVGKCWDILEKLYHRSYYVHELAEELGKSDAGVSTYLSDLREEGLIDFDEGERRRRYYRLADRGRKIIEVIKGTEKPQEKPSLNEEEFEKLLERFHNPETRDLALKGLEDMIISHTPTSDGPIKKVFELLKSGKENIPLKIYRIFSRLCYEGKKEGLLDDELSYEIAKFASSRIRDNSITREERREARDLWVNLDTKIGSDDIIDYCLSYARIEGDQNYEEEKDFIRDTLKGAIRSEEKREEVRQRLWKLVEEECEEKIKKRYETFLHFDVGLYKGALTQRHRGRVRVVV